MLRRLALALLLLCACDGEPAAPEEPAPEPEPAPDTPTGDAPTAEAPPPPADAPDDFEPVTLPAGGDGCEGPAVWLGPRTVRRVPALDGERTGWPSSLPPGVAREVWVAMTPGASPAATDALGVLRAMTGSYNGPGGEPLFRWRQQQTSSRPVLMVDRRVPRARLLQAIRGLPSAVPVRVGGVDEEGARRCAIGTFEAPDDLGAQQANALLDGRLGTDGELSVSDTRVEAQRPLPSEADEGLHVLRFEVPEGVSAEAVVRAIAAARWSERRYAWLVQPSWAPHCLPLVSGCGCAEGCAQAVRLLEGPPTVEQSFRPMLGARVEVRSSADAAPREARVELWCFDQATGSMSPVQRIEGPDCFEVYVTEGRCGGGCVARAKPDCAACEACDLSCAGEPVR